MVKLSLKDLSKVIQIGESQLSSSNSTAGALYHYPVLTTWKQPRSSCFSFCFLPPPFPQTHTHTHTQNTRHTFRSLRVCMLSYFSHVQLCNPMACSPPGPSRLLCPWDSPGKNTGVGCHVLLQGIFLSHRLNPSLMSPALAGEFLTTSTTLEAPSDP